MHWNEKHGFRRAWVRWVQVVSFPTDLSLNKLLVISLTMAKETNFVNLHVKHIRKMANMTSLKNVVSLLVMMIYSIHLVALKSPYKKAVFGILPVHASWMEKLEMMVLSLVNEKMIILRIKLWKLISVLILPVVIQPITHAKRLVFFCLRA